MRMLARSRHFRCRHSVLHRGGLSEHGSDSTCEQDPIENEMPGAHEPYPRGAHQASSLQEFWRQPRVRLLCHREQVQDVHCSDAWPPPKYACPEEGQAGRRIQTTGFLTVMLFSYQRHVAAVCIRDHSPSRVCGCGLGSSKDQPADEWAMAAAGQPGSHGPLPRSLANLKREISGMKRVVER